MALLLMLYPKYFASLINAILFSKQTICCSIHERHIELRIGGRESKYLFLDGLKNISSVEKSVWTIEHWNGTLISIPKELLNHDMLDYVREMAADAKRKREAIGLSS